MALSEHVSIVITQDTVGIERAGFGTPMILSATAAWAERLRYYASLLEVADDFAATTPEYLAARAVFSQSPRPKRLAIGRSALKPTLRYTIAVRTVSNSTAYEIRVVGEGFTGGTASYTSDSAATEAEIVNGIVTALNAISGNNYLAAFAPLVVPDFTFTGEADDDTLTATAHGLETGDGPVQVSNSGGALPGGLTAVTDYWVIRTGANTFQLATSLANALAGTFVALSTDGTGTQTLSDTGTTARPSDPFTVTGDAAGEWFALEALDTTLWDLAVDHANPGVATDLDAIALEQPDWYGLITLYNSDAYVKAAAAWTEANKRLYFAALSETEAIHDASDGTQGTLDDLMTLGYRRTTGFYHPAPDQFLDAATMGVYFPTEPGEAVVAYKQLSGVEATVLTGTERANLDDRNANYYKSEVGVSFTWKGKASGGEWIDVTRDLDWVEDDMSKGIFGMLVGSAKVPYTDKGVARVEAQVRASLRRAVARGIFAEDPEPVVTVPLVADVASVDKANRHLPDVKFTATLAGAILTVDVIGVVSV